MEQHGVGNGGLEMGPEHTLLVLEDSRECRADRSPHLGVLRTQIEEWHPHWTPRS